MALFRRQDGVELHLPDEHSDYGWSGFDDAVLIAKAPPLTAVPCGSC